jgi:hypothetical protein
MRMQRHRSLWPLTTILVVVAAGVSCSALTFDCGQPSTRQAYAFGTIPAIGDTFHVDGYASVYEERDNGGAYAHQLIIGLQATDPGAQGRPAPAALRGHVTFVSLFARDSVLLFRTSLPNAASDEPTVIGVAATNDLPQSEFDNIRALLLADQLEIRVETDLPTIQLPTTTLVVKQSYDWRKGGCQ